MLKVYVCSSQMKVLFTIVSLICSLSTLSPAQLIVAHRGASADAIENTLPAFQLAWSQGADIIEGDFYLTKDKKIVCFHDPSIKRLANKAQMIEKSTWEQLRDINLEKNSKKTAVRMPLLKEVLKTVPQGKGIFIEIKSKMAIAPFLKKEIEASRIKANQVHIISFNPYQLIHCKKLMPHIKTQWLVNVKKSRNGRIKPTIKQISSTLRAIKADSLGMNWKSPHLTADNIANFKKAGYTTNVWTVNDAKTLLKLTKLKIDYITTDKPTIKLK